ncbi:ornithine cyclodeaminase family protein [Flavisolibacter sp. BT320]|nr:ornithine cyclodeaminase family protein [Flavisolibacter longurius]
MSSNKNKTLVLSSFDIQEILRHFGVDWIMMKLVERLRLAIHNYNPQKLSIPIRSGFHYEKPEPGLIEWMPLYNQNDRGGKVLIKVVGYHPSNPNKLNLPTIVSTISEYDTDSGHLCALIDGVLATAIRTGAASAVASKLMAKPTSSVLGLIGCGTQAVTQLHAISLYFKIERVLFYDSDPNALASFEKRCSALNVDIEFVSTNIEEIVRNSDILCTATSIDIGAGPLFSNIETKPHLHINAVGSDFPGKIEIPLELLKKCFVCPDFVEQAIVEGECQQLEQKEIGAVLVEVVKNGDKYAYLQNERTVFDSTGWALEDKVVMELFLDCASELGLGQELEIEHRPNDTKSPYDFLKAENIRISNTDSPIKNTVSILSAQG